MADVIKFYRTGNEYGSFSNFAAYPIEIDGKTWPTSEHYFQAQKFAGIEHEEAMRLEPSPMVVARMGRDRRKPLRPDWEKVKDGVMRKAVLAKFTQHAELRAMLLGTGDAVIVEHTEKDLYWGDGGNGSGRNMLGRILMEVRERLRGET
ncbi:MAG: NADAR family protein [Isosphaeraceae bacterium]